VELLEREPFLTRLTEHLRRAAAGRGRVVFVGGEAGVGKTTLVEEFRQRVGGSAEVLRASCDALSTPGPLGPLRDLAPALGLRIAPGDIAGGQREGLFHSVRDAFAARPGPTVVIGEDAHWSDGASLDLVRFLARRIDDLALLLIITYRDDEVGPTHPLRLILGDLATAPTVHRLTLPPLSVDAVATLAAGSGLDPAALHRLTGGNPFFVSEALAAGGAGVPATVGDAVLARAARLSPEARAVLDVAATIGAAIDVELLAAVAGPVLDAAEDGIAGGLLRATADGLAFRHELAREAVLGAIAPPRRRLLHARILEALRESPLANNHPARLAHHAEAAGDRAATLQFAVAAAEQAADMHAHREAAAQYARALRVADHLPDAERARLHEGRANACFFSDHGEDAIAERQAALALWHAVGDRLKEGENLRWLSHLAWLEGRGADAEAAANAALAVLESMPPGPELAMAYSNLAQLRMLDHDLAGTLEWGGRAIALAERLGEDETRVHALTNVGSARMYAGDEGGVDELTRSLQLALAHGFVDHAMRAFNNLAWFAMLTMRLDDAERRFATAIAYAVDHNLDAYHRYLLAGRATLRALRGDWDAAARDSRRLLRQPMLSPVTRIVALTTLGHLAARRGDADADATLDEALALAERTGILLRLRPVRAARAEAALLRGDHERARSASGRNARPRARQSLGPGRIGVASPAGRRPRRANRRSGRAVDPPDRRRLARRRRRLGASWLPVRSGAGAGGCGRTRSGAASGRRLRSARGATGGGARHPPFAVARGARSAGAAARPASGDARQPRRPDAARIGSAGAGRRRAAQRRDRRAALSDAENGRPSCLGDAGQAWRGQPRRSDPRRPTAWDRARSIWERLGHKVGNPADAAPPAPALPS
jgi:AAA ATPase domain